MKKNKSKKRVLPVRKHYYSVAEVALFCSVDSKLVRKWINQGEIRPISLPNSYLRIYYLELVRFMDKHGMIELGGLNDPTPDDAIPEFIGEIELRKHGEETADPYFRVLFKRYKERGRSIVAYHEQIRQLEKEIKTLKEIHNAN